MASLISVVLLLLFFSISLNLTGGTEYNEKAEKGWFENPLKQIYCLMLYLHSLFHGSNFFRVFSVH